ncbi:MAG: ABC transporter ATP-binding protein [Phycisphaerae bacterium]|nr:ABC transporter ATP-binding protein [Phycisphaerae bacterium]MCZ2401286.1 ABC transporter ATP-binding protein [Phycisphaerae bacterium]
MPSARLSTDRPAPLATARAESWRLALADVDVHRGQRRVLHGATMEIGPGECVALIGPNGAGKTTLLLTMLGLLRPARGRVELDGRPLRRFSTAARGRFCAYLPQTTERLPGFSVYELATLSRNPHVRPLQPLTAHDLDAVRGAIRDCGLAGLAHRPVNALSGGERKRALLAAALAQEPSLLLLDEPSAALDPAHQVELARLLRKWLEEPRRSLVFVSHDLQLPSVLGARVVALCDGRVVADGPGAAVLTPAMLQRVFGTSFETAVAAQGRAYLLPQWG